MEVFLEPSRNLELCEYHLNSIEFWHSLPGVSAHCTKLPPASGTICKQMIHYQVICDCCQIWLQIENFHDPPLRFNNFLECLMEPRETLKFNSFAKWIFTVNIFFHNKGYEKDTNEQSGEEIQRVSSGRVPHARASVSCLQKAPILIDSRCLNSKRDSRSCSYLKRAREPITYHP